MIRFDAENIPKSTKQALCILMRDAVVHYFTLENTILLSLGQVTVDEQVRCL